MTRKLPGAIAMLVAALTGCAGSQNHLRILESGGNVRVEQAQAAGYDYLVYVRNVVDFGYDPDVEATRYSIALQILEAQCPGATVIGEEVIETGTYLGGRPSRTYVIRVAC